METNYDNHGRFSASCRFVTDEISVIRDATRKYRSRMFNERIKGCQFHGKRQNQLTSDY